MAQIVCKMTHCVQNYTLRAKLYNTLCVITHTDSVNTLCVITHTDSVTVCKITQCAYDYTLRAKVYECIITHRV